MKLAERVNPSIQEKLNAPQLSLTSLMNHFKTKCVTRWLGFLKIYCLILGRKKSSGGFFEFFFAPTISHLVQTNVYTIHCFAVYSKASWLFEKCILEVFLERLNSWTSILQKTRVFCSMLFTVPATVRY
jgi:hypothetical protein